MKKFIKTYWYNDDIFYTVSIEEDCIDYTTLYSISINCEQQNLHDYVTVWYLSNIEVKMNELIKNFVKKIKPTNLTELEILMNKLKFEPNFDVILNK